MIKFTKQKKKVYIKCQKSQGVDTTPCDEGFTRISTEYMRF